MLMNTVKFVTSYVGKCLMAAFFELFKFGVVLMLTYMVAMAIFFVWDRTLVGHADKILKAARINNNNKENIDPKANNAKYPFVVEIPIKRSIDSIKSDTMKTVKISSKEEIQAMKAIQQFTEAKDSDEEHDQAIGKKTTTTT